MSCLKGGVCTGCSECEPGDTLVPSYSLERDERKHYQEVVRCLDIEQKKNASLTIENQINRWAAENSCRENTELLQVLRDIANVDYRGNRSQESVMAYNALIKYSPEDKK